jgi:methylase of polypeptide subunit release factors
MPLKVSDDTFVPTITTQMIAEQVRIPSGATVLDLGCGVGPITIHACRCGAGRVYGVDIMGEACRLARENVKLNQVADRVEVLQGDLFDAVGSLKFDVIIDDVSGMSEDVSRISPWYPRTIPTGGEDGTGPTLRMLEEAPDHLNPGGALYFPVLSLSRFDRILHKARDIYGAGLRELVSRRIPFCEEFKARLAEMEELRRRGLIHFERVRSRFFWTLGIYCATLRELTPRAKRAE